MFQIIATTSIGLITIIGTLSVFRLQWLRKELDDYRGRITTGLNQKPDLLNNTEEEVTKKVKAQSEKFGLNFLADFTDEEFSKTIAGLFNKIDGVKDIRLNYLSHLKENPTI